VFTQSDDVREKKNRSELVIDRECQRKTFVEVRLRDCPVLSAVKWSPSGAETASQTFEAPYPSSWRLVGSSCNRKCLATLPPANQHAPPLMPRNGVTIAQLLIVLIVCSAEFVQLLRIQHVRRLKVSKESILPPLPTWLGSSGLHPLAHQAGACQGGGCRWCRG
jgi:hypothetical protein